MGKIITLPLSRPSFLGEQAHSCFSSSARIFADGSAFAMYNVLHICLALQLSGVLSYCLALAFIANKFPSSGPPLH